MRPPKAVFLVQKIGPYHDARLRAWVHRRGGNVDVIEYRPNDTVYAWTPVTSNGSYPRFATRSNGELRERLERSTPSVLICVGYADPEIHAAAAWALERRVSLVTCSDSTYQDETRSWVKEHFKRWVVSVYDSALVSGSRAHAYLEHLGVDAQRRFAPWDVVDNGYFSTCADLIRKTPERARRRLGLPRAYFLCVARFVAKKNLGCLLSAYARYVAAARHEPWVLVLSGAGPLDESLRQQVRSSGLEGKVVFSGFVQYPDLPVYYALAGALVLPSLAEQWGLVVNEAMAAGLPVLVSTACGCAPDLVSDGVNGYTFEATDEVMLANRLTTTAETSAPRREEMGTESRRRIALYSPETFAEGLENAVEAALGRRRSARWASRALLQTLAKRSIPS